MSIAFVQPQTWQAKRAKAEGLFVEVKAILEDPNSDAEKRGKVPEMIADAKRYQAEALQLKEIEAAIPLLAEQAAAAQVKEAPVKPSELKEWRHFLFEVWKAGHPKVQEKAHPGLRLFVDNDEKADDRGSAKDLSGAAGATGGYLIPAEFQATLLAAMAPQSIVRSRATIIPMRRRQLDMPVLDQTGTTAGRPHWFGGMQFFWEEEGGEKDTTDPAFRALTLVARKLIGFTRASDELLDDSAISLEAFFSGPLGFAGGAAWMEDYAFLRGTGAGQPLGVIHAPATIQHTRAGAGVTYADLVGIVSKFMPSGRGVWLASQSVLPALMNLEGPPGNPALLWIGAFQPGGIANGIPGTLLGYPIIFVEKLPALGYQGDIGLFDFSYYLLGDRQATTVESTKFEKWREDKTSWRMVHRVEGRPWLSAPLTYEDGVTQVSPFVTLSGNAGS